MIRTVTITESRRELVELDAENARALRETGKRLASRVGWWGQAEDEPSLLDRTVISVEGSEPGRWWVRVADCVGVIRVGDTQIVVQPKIPTEHLLFLFALSDEFPRLDPQRADVEASPSLWELIARWFVASGEQLLRLGLLRDYQTERDELRVVRGEIDPLATGAAFYSGRVGLVCQFDEFGLDTPLNRLLKAAAATVVRNGLLSQRTRRRAVGILSHLQDVSDIRVDDRRASTDRRSAHYADAIILAQHILDNHGRTLSHGTDLSWAFLIRTPEMVEAGLRKLLARELGAHRVSRGSRQAVGSTMSFNPDLVFDGGAAVGDVKYKLSGGDWSRPDLYQTIAFAEAFGTSKGVILRFREPGVVGLQDLAVGTKTVREITWIADEFVPAATSARDVVMAARLWLDGELSLSA